MTHYPDHIGAAKLLLEKQAEVNALRAERDTLAAHVTELKGSTTTCAFPSCVHPDHQRNAAPAQPPPAPDRAADAADLDCEELVEIFADFIGQWDRSHEVITVGHAHLPQLRITHLRRTVLALQRLGRERDAAIEDVARLKTQNDGLRQLAIEAREAANSWQQAIIDLYSGREEPHPADCSCGRPEASGASEQPAPEPKGPTRRNVLLAAIQREGGDWSPLRARTALMNAGHDVTSNLAAQEMKTLAAHGFLEQVRPRAYTYRLAAPQQEPQCASNAHPDFVEDQTIRCELSADHTWHRNGERTWTP